MRLAWITNIPTPYRNHQYSRMAKILPRQGIDFHVHFTAWTERRRPWRFAAAELHYPFTLHQTPVEFLATRDIHLNPSLLGVLRDPSLDALVVGGWATPSHALAPFFACKNVAKFLFCESHAGTQRRSHSLARTLKKVIIGRYDGFLVPGVRSRDLLCSLNSHSLSKPWETIPNVIDAHLFRDRVQLLRSRRSQLRDTLGVHPSEQLWFCPARLSPEKGLAEFLPELRGLGNVRLLLAGDGPLEAVLRRLVSEQALRVTFLGHVDVERVLELYAAADLFVLPSLADASPLSAVEAAAAGLPLILSSHAGNSAELVNHGVNGWIYDVDGGDSRGTLLREVAMVPLEKLNAMGSLSRQVYQSSFETDACIERVGAFISRVVHTKREQRKARPLL